MIEKDVRKIHLFSHLSDEDLAIVIDRGFSRNYAKGEALLSQEEADAPVFFLLAGAVRIFRINKEGREQVLAYLRCGDVFNLPTAFLGMPEAPAFAQAMSSVTAFEIPSIVFQELAAMVPAIALAVMRDLSEKLVYMTDLVHDLSLLDVRSRLVKFLLEKHNKPDSSSRWTHEKIALQIGTSREVVSRMLKALANDGLIRMERGKLAVINKTGLIKIIDD